MADVNRVRARLVTVVREELACVFERSLALGAADQGERVLVEPLGVAGRFFFGQRRPIA